MPTIIFEPTGRRIKVEAGENLLEVCWTHGIPIESLCGGNGTCGKCAVQIIDHDFPISPEDREFFDEERLAQGWRLACQARVERDMRVSVPLPPSVLTGRIVTAGEALEIELAPKVRKHFLKLEPPTSKKPGNDVELVCRALPDGEKLTFRSTVLRKLSGVLQKAGYHVTVTVWNGAVLDIEPRDTTRYNYGIAFDVGTSTVAALLVDLNTGKELGVAAALNPQRKYGEDVISRITFCRERPDGAQILSREINTLLTELAERVTTAHGVSPTRVNEYTVVGNTTMTHLIGGVDPSPLGVVPFKPVIIGCQIMPEGPEGAKLGRKPFEIPATLGAFVGSDIVAGAVALGVDKTRGKRLLIDIGTNAEVLAGGADRMLATSTAAGPAFEGVKIECGMIGVSGAIDACRLEEDDLVLDVMGNGEALGICGSGLVDIVAVLLDLGVIDASGRLLSADECRKIAPPKVCQRLQEVNDMRRVALTDEVYLSQRDVRELQSAKAAIAAGIEILLDHLGTPAQQLDEILVAGAFGSTLNPRSAQRIGVIPNVPLKKVRAVGNTALQGAKAFLLSTKTRAEICSIGERVELIELSTEPDFMGRFAENMRFPK